MRIESRFTRGALALLASMLFCVAADGGDGYRLPPQAIIDVVEAAPAPTTSVSPDHEWLLLVERDALPSIEDLSRPMLRLAGRRIDPAANGMFQTGYSRALRLRPLADPTAEPRSIAEGKLGGVTWSHDSERFFFTRVTDAGTELWGATVDSSETPRRLVTGLNTVFQTPRWLRDGTSIICAVIPEGRGPVPAPPVAPSGPNIQETSGETSPLRTFQDLLTNAYDEQLFEYYGRGQLTVVDWSGKTRPLGEPGMIIGSETSPDGMHYLVTSLDRPWTTTHAFWQFPHRYAVWSGSGKLERTIALVPLAKDIPIGGVELGPRNLAWHPMRPATLLWVYALDDGDPKKEVPHRDAWVALPAPFEAEPTELWRTEHRARGIEHFRSPTHFVFSDYDRDRRWTRSTVVDVAHPETAKVIEDRSVRDRYADPGRLVLEPRPGGIKVILQRGDWVFRRGQGASKDGVFPFLSQQNVRTGETRTMWRSGDGVYEPVIDVWEAGGDIHFLTRHESPTSPPNLRWNSLTGEPRAITHFPDPTPQIRGVKKELIQYERADGVPLSATLYLPADHRDGERLPLLIWAYPVEYNDPTTAGQVGVSRHRFTRIGGSSHLHLLSQGYAILDGATIPIIGEPETMNDTFIEQLVAATQSAIDVAVERGVADRNRVAIGGHSYGAFMTANLLAHSDIVHAGIARSGAYNRTLTPFGFQSERRTLWEAPQIYFGISPFMHAHTIDEPILLIHGELDNNSGTYPIQSKRLFSAIQGNGGTARLVMLPYESHGYRARESVLHCLAEMVDWLDTHVKERKILPAGYDEGAGK